MLPAWLIALIPNIINGAKEIITRKQTIRELETNAEISIKKAELDSKIRRAESADLADSKVDALSVENTGFKDEYLLLITTFPLVITMLSPFVDLVVGMFTGGMYMVQDGENVRQMATYYPGMLTRAVTESFTALGSAPQAYWWAVGAVYIHSLGMRRMVNNIIEKFGDRMFTNNKK